MALTYNTAVEGTLTESTLVLIGTTLSYTDGRSFHRLFSSISQLPPDSVSLKMLVSEVKRGEKVVTGYILDSFPPRLHQT